jgi:hypothetical protein
MRSGFLRTTTQRCMLPSQRNSNSSGTVTSLGTPISAPVLERFRTVQSITELPLFHTIFAALSARRRSMALRSTMGHRCCQIYK